jgi:hypothetical protein
MVKNDIQALLTEWGRWTKTGGVDVGFPHSTPFYRLSKSAGWASREPLISDELAGRIDRAVASLELRCRHKDTDMRYQALEWTYLRRRPLYQLAEKHRVDRRQASSSLRAAESWVDSQIFTDEIIVALVER